MGATLELCSGSGAFSRIAKEAGFYPNITLDNRSTGPNSPTTSTDILRIAAGWYATPAWVGVTPTKAESPRGCLRIPMAALPALPITPNRTRLEENLMGIKGFLQLPWWVATP